MTTALIVLAAASLLVPAADEAEASSGVKVMAFNLLFEGSDDAKNVEVIQQTAPDVVCLTELTPEFAARVKRDLPAYAHRAFFPKAGTWGVGILSKVKLSKVQRFEQKPHRMPAVEAVAATRDGPLRVECVHLFPPVAKRDPKDSAWESMKKNQELRTAQAAALVAKLKPVPGPVVVLGDFNEGRDDPALQTLLGAGFNHACVNSKQCGATWPGATSALPAVVEIDHILGRGVGFVDAQVVKGGGSDHYPVVATVRVAPAKP